MFYCMFYFTCDRSLIQATDYNPIAIIIIAIMTRSRLWSVANTLRDVHVPRRSATSVSNWLGFPRMFGRLVISAMSVFFT